MNRPRFGRPVTRGFGAGQAPIERERPRVPSRADHQAPSSIRPRRRTSPQRLASAGVPLRPREGSDSWSKARAPTVSFRPRGEYVIARFTQGFRSSLVGRSATPSASGYRLAADDETQVDERRQRGSMYVISAMPRLLRCQRHGGQRGRRQQGAPLPLVDRCEQGGDEALGPDVGCPPVEGFPRSRARAAAWTIRSGWPSSAAQSCSAAARSVASRDARSRLQQQQGIIGRQTLQREVVSFAPQAPRARGDDECGTRSDIAHLFQLVLGDVQIVEKDQRVLLLEAASNLGLGAANLVPFVEGFEDGYGDRRGLMPC